MEKVQEIFSPELMNRIDESLIFRSLSEENVYDIIDLQVNDLKQNMDKLGIQIKLQSSAKKLLAQKGYDAQYGVRLLRRQIQKSLEDPIAEMLLKKEIKDGMIISIKSINNNFVFTYNEKSKKVKKQSKR